MPSILTLTAALTFPGFVAGVELGGDEAANSAVFETFCDSYERRVLDPAELPIAETSHVQIDCSGYDYMEAGRLAEFVFADGRLSHVWILVTEAEVDDLQIAFEDAYGQASVESEDFAAFFQINGTVRRDIPEALFYAEHVAPMFEAWFSNPQ